jgi:hypothetical protein
VLGRDASLGPLGKEPLQTEMPETLYHWVTVTRNVSGVNWFCGPLILCPLKILDLDVSLLLETHREIGI